MSLIIGMYFVIFIGNLGNKRRNLICYVHFIWIFFFRIHQFFMLGCSIFGLLHALPQLFYVSQEKGYTRIIAEAISSGMFEKRGEKKDVEINRLASYAKILKTNRKKHEKLFRVSFYLS